MATNPQTTSSTSSTSSTTKSKLKQIEALVVKSVAKEFRRIGLAFTREATHLDPSLLTDAQVQALNSDPNLVVTTATVTVPANQPANGTPVVTPVAAAPAADDSAAK